MSKGVHLLQENAPAHNGRVAIIRAVNCGSELLPHPTCSPDPAPSDYHLFLSMKKQLRGGIFADEETMAAVLNMVDSFKTHFFYVDLKALAKRCEKRARLNGDYVEK